MSSTLATVNGKLTKSMLLQFIGTQLAKFLTKERIYKDAYYRVSIENIKSSVKPGDVVLVEGQSRASSAIQFITGSNWSHAAVFIGKAKSFNHCLIEVKAVEGCKYTDVNAYRHHNLRICRPIFLNDKKRAIIIKHLKKKIGSKYDLRNIFDLIRYVYPNPPVPKKFRRNLIGIGAGNPTKAICSSLIADAFKEVDHPILPFADEFNNIINEDPQFVSAPQIVNGPINVTQTDFSVNANSPAINAGNPNYSPADDIDGNPRPEPEIGGDAISSTSFENGSGGWTNFGSEIQISSDESLTGNNSLLTSNRTANWHSPKISLNNLLNQDETYTFYVWVKLAEGETGTAQLTIKDVDENEYYNLNQATKQ